MQFVQDAINKVYMSRIFPKLKLQEAASYVHFGELEYITIMINSMLDLLCLISKSNLYNADRHIYT